MLSHGLQVWRHTWQPRFDQVLRLLLGSQALQQTKTCRGFLHPVDRQTARAAGVWPQPTLWLCQACQGMGTRCPSCSSSAKPSPLQVTRCHTCRYKAENTAQYILIWHLSSSKKRWVVTSKTLKLQVTTADP